MDESEVLVGRVRDAFSLSLFHAGASLQRGAAALLRGDRESVAPMCDMLHRLVGTASSLGLDTVAIRCRALEKALLASDDRWYSRLFAVVRAMDDGARPMRSVALSTLRVGSARSRTLLAAEALTRASSLRWPVQLVKQATDCPHPPRGVLLVDARRDAMNKVRGARAVWGAHPLVAIAPDASEAEVLLSLRAGADVVCRDEITDESLAIAAWSALDPPLVNGSMLVLDGDPVRSSAMRAAIEPLGARLHMIDARAQLEERLRTVLPHVALIDAAHPEADAVAAVLGEQGGTVRVVSLGPAPWSDVAITEAQSFAECLRAVGSTFTAAMGPDDIVGTQPAASTQTLRISRAELRSLSARKEPSRP